MGGNPLNDLRPDLLAKLASIAVHAEEYLSPHGHPLDRDALASLLADPQVRAWTDDMVKLSLAPRMRNPRQ